MFIGNQMQTYVTAAFLDHQEQNAEIIGFQFGAELVFKPIRGVNLEKNMILGQGQWSKTSQTQPGFSKGAFPPCIFCISV